MPTDPQPATMRAFYDRMEEAITTDTPTDIVLDDVAAERFAQTERWGVQHHPDGTSLNNADYRDQQRRLCQDAEREDRVTWAHILTEEVAEAFAEVDPVRLRAELIQVAAVCTAWVEDIDGRTT